MICQASSVADAALSGLLVPSTSDPYTSFACLRQVDPVFRSPTTGMTIVTGFTEVESGLHDPRLQVGLQPGVKGARGVGGLVSNGIRRIIQGALSGQTVSRMLPEIRAIVHRLLDNIDGDAIDFMSAVAFPLPIEVMGELLGVPPVDRTPFRSLADAVSLESAVDPVTFARAKAAYVQMRNYFQDLVTDRYGRRTEDDFLSNVIMAAEHERIERDALITHLVVLFWAGFETTAHFLGNGMAVLLQHPAQLTALRRGEYTVRSAVHEMLRFDAPVTMVTRLPAISIELGNVVLTPDDTVLVALAAANRDPRMHDEPDCFRLDRRPPRHMSFGSGVHACLGAGLALLEGEALFSGLISRYGVLHFGGEPVRRQGIGLRGFEFLPVLART